MGLSTFRMANADKVVSVHHSISCPIGTLGDTGKGAFRIRDTEDAEKTKIKQDQRGAGPGNSQELRDCELKDSGIKNELKNSESR